jgi:hypothetical protein
MGSSAACDQATCDERQYRQVVDVAALLPRRNPDVEALQAVKRRGIKLHIVHGNPSSRAVLADKSAHLQQAQAVMLCGLDSKEKAAADMQVSHCKAARLTHVNC